MWIHSVTRRRLAFSVSELTKANAAMAQHAAIRCLRLRDHYCCTRGAADKIYHCVESIVRVVRMYAITSL